MTNEEFDAMAEQLSTEEYDLVFDSLTFDDTSNTITVHVRGIGPVMAKTNGRAEVVFDHAPARDLIIEPPTFGAESGGGYPLAVLSALVFGLVIGGAFARFLRSRTNHVLADRGSLANATPG